MMCTGRCARALTGDVQASGALAAAARRTAHGDGAGRPGEPADCTRRATGRPRGRLSDARRPHRCRSPRLRRPAARQRQAPSSAARVRRSRRSRYRSALARRRRRVPPSPPAQAAPAPAPRDASRARSSAANAQPVHSERRESDEPRFGKKRQIEAVRVKGGRVAVGDAHERVEARESRTVRRR